MAKGEDLEYVATFEVFPAIDKLDIRDHQIEKEIVSVEDEDIDRTIETLRQQRTSWEASEAPAALGDRLLIDYIGTIDDEPFDGGSAEDYAVVLGQGSLLPEFEQGLSDQLTGSEVSIEAKFPDDYPAEAVAGKKANFAVTIKEIGKPVLPDVDGDFISAFGVSDGTEAAFRLQIRENLEREAESRVQAKVRSAVFDALLDGNEFDLPKALVQEEVNRSAEGVRRQLDQQGLPSDQPIDLERYRPEAERRVRLGLVMRESLRDRGIKVDDSKVRPRVEQLAQSYEDPSQVIDWYYADPSRFSQVEGVVLEELLIKELIEEASVVEKKVTLQEVMNPAASEAVKVEQEQEQDMEEL